MSTLILKIRMDSHYCIGDKDEIYRALRALVAYTDVDIEDDELRTLMDEALELKDSMVGGAYEIEED